MTLAMQKGQNQNQNETQYTQSYDMLQSSHMVSNDNSRLRTHEQHSSDVNNSR